MGKFTYTDDQHAKLDAIEKACLKMNEVTHEPRLEPFIAATEAYKALVTPDVVMEIIHDLRKALGYMAID